MADTMTKTPTPALMLALICADCDPEVADDGDCGGDAP
jgi:hypothetical protein